MREERLFNVIGQVDDVYVAEANPFVKKTKKHLWIKWCAAAATICFIIAGIFTGRQAIEVYAMEISYISIDVNPSLELCLNKYNRVVNVNAYNEDGQRVADCLDVKNKYYTDALEEILHNEVFCSYLGDESDLLFTIVSENEDEMKENITACTQNEVHTGTITCSNIQTREIAHENHCSVGKYTAYEQLLQYDETVTVEDCLDMSIHEIHQRIEECSNHHGTINQDSSVTNDSNQNSETSTSTTHSSHHSERHH